MAFLVFFTSFNKHWNTFRVFSRLVLHITPLILAPKKKIKKKIYIYIFIKGDYKSRCFQQNLFNAVHNL